MPRELILWSPQSRSNLGDRRVQYFAHTRRGEYVGLVEIIHSWQSKAPPLGYLGYLAGDPQSVANNAGPDDLHLTQDEVEAEYYRRQEAVNG